MAVLVEVVMLPLGSVNVMGIITATGVVGTAVTGPGEGVITMLSDTGAGGFETGESILLAGTRASGAL